MKIHEDLNLSNYVTSHYVIKSMKLYAVICSDEPGHFVAFRKNAEENEWYCYDDNEVKKMQ